MKAQQLESDLRAKLQGHRAAIGQLTQERAGLLLAAASGDAGAVQRSAAIRTELAEHEAAGTDLDAALRDLAPQVRQERQEAELARRHEAVAVFETFAGHVAEVAGEVDVAIEQLRAVLERANPRFETFRQAAASLTVPQDGNLGQRVINQLVELSTFSGVASDPDWLLDHLRAHGVLRRDTRPIFEPATVQESITRQTAAILQRIHDRTRTIAAGLQADVEPVS